MDYLKSFQSWQSMQDQRQGDLRRKDGFDILREVDELWYHLLLSGDVSKLKSNSILNIDFLMASVKEASISYVRSVLELVRGQVLDFEIELLYNVTKHAVQSVSRDPNQLANEILIWLRPFCKSSSTPSISKLSPEELPALDILVKETYTWCSNVSIPLLVPTNSWLHLPLSPQVSVITAPWPSIVSALLAPNGQTLIASCGPSFHFFHLASRKLIKTIEGHRQNITCFCLTTSGRYLVTGCEDTTVNVWRLETDPEVACKLEHRLGHHVSGVLCVAVTHNEELILSGSEIGAICVAKLSSGGLLTRLEHHRGMVTCIQINSGDDIFASGSTDSTVIIWSLEDFMVLNHIVISNPVMHMDISSDSTFMILSCEDNSVHIRAVTTGSHVHHLTVTLI